MNSVRRRRILVVDDDPRILKTVSRILEGAGFEVHATKHSARAAHLAEEVRPALAILDVSMPEKDGFDLARQIRSKPRTARTRVMFLTAQQTGPHIEEARESGALAYLQKPFKGEDLLRMVRSVFSIAKSS